MKKSTKGALAAGAAAVLLLGGVGTLAFWTDSETIDGGSVSSGELALENGQCDDDWAYAEGNASAGETVGLIVPGDSLAKECTFDITAAGDNLQAELTTPDDVDLGSTPEAPTLEASVDAEFTIGGSPVPAVITEDNDGDTVTATLTVTFPFGTEATENANDTRNLLITLDEITVTLTQTES
ncbi:alternate-type signal peptide domain-containing protein [Aeromicrobium sp. CTD01-1L150]|uniref:alternate-type signal peptide domain-containing protein n=1 Tax=Aeromicrobium sp. CTD01-1L150 TaxID=3341830 RepID=UPI0035C02FFF